MKADKKILIFEIKNDVLAIENENIDFVFDKANNRICIKQDDAGYQIFYDNEFMRLKKGDYLQVNNQVFAVSMENEGEAVSIDLAIQDAADVYPDLDFSLEEVRQQNDRFEVDALLSNSTMIDDPLSFLFHQGKQIATLEKASVVANQYNRPLPLLKNHFNARSAIQQPLNASNNFSLSGMDEITVIEQEEQQGNILQELGFLTGEQQASVATVRSERTLRLDSEEFEIV